MPSNPFCFYFAQGYKPAAPGQEPDHIITIGTLQNIGVVSALGTFGVLRLDGRRNHISHIETANDWAAKHGYVAFTIQRGKYSRSTQIGQVYATEVQHG